MKTFRTLAPAALLLAVAGCGNPSEHDSPAPLQAFFRGYRPHSIQVAAEDGTETRVLGVGEVDSQPYRRRYVSIVQGEDSSALYLNPIDGGGSVLLHRAPRIRSAALAPDGATVAFSRYDMESRLMRLYLLKPGGSPVLLATGEQIIDPVFSPNGSMIAYNGAVRDLLVIPARPGSAPVTVATNVSTGRGAWAPDGGRLAYVGRTLGTYQDDIYVVGANGCCALRMTNDREDESAPSWSPDGSRLLFSSDTPDYRNPGYLCTVALNAPGNKMRIWTPEKDSSVGYVFNNWQAPQWSSDGRRILMTVGTGSYAPSRLCVLDPVSLHVTVLSPGISGYQSFWVR